ncbi:hypothetical protein D3C87_2041770 [compost metagenome]
MSRPISSVPSRKSAEGGFLTLVKPEAKGTWVASSGAKTANTTKKMTMAPPKSAPRLRASFLRPRKRRRGATISVCEARVIAGASGGD